MAVLIVYPKDETTLFLKPIIEYLKSNVDNNKFEVFQIEATNESHVDCINKIDSLNNGCLIFLGHGTSYCLGGAREGDYEHPIFITKENQGIFKNKNLIFLACRSEEFIKSLNSDSFLAAIGFGDLPTEWNEITAAREMNIYAYQGFSQIVLDEFKKILVDITKYSLEDAFQDNLSLNEIYLRFKLRFNKRIPTVLEIGKEVDYKVLSDLMYEVKREIGIYGNLNSVFMTSIV